MVEDEIKKYEKARTSLKNKISELTAILSQVVSEESFDKSELGAILEQVKLVHKNQNVLREIEN